MGGAAQREHPSHSREGSPPREPAPGSRKRTSLEALFSLVTRLEPGEGRSVGLCFANGFSLLFAIYLLRPVREALVLADGGAENRSYAVGAMALVSMLVLPCYGALYRRYGKALVTRGNALVFLAGLVLFWLATTAGLRIGFAFFVWLGVVGAIAVAQFWALATELYDVESGSRLFPVIALGVSLGAWTGSLVAAEATLALGSGGVMVLAGAALTATLLLSESARQWGPSGTGRRCSSAFATPKTRPLAGFASVVGSRYLLLIALSVVLLNWINGIGDFIMAQAVADRADALVSDGSAAGRGELIGAIYGRFYAWVNLLGLLVQVLLVSRLMRTLGVAGAALVLPLIMALGYALVACVPIFAIVHAIKTIENCCSHSIQSTSRHALFLPLGGFARFEGKIVIDTFFWRLGDLIQVATIYVGTTWLGLEARHFGLLNVGLALALVLVVVLIGRRYARLSEPHAGGA